MCKKTKKNSKTSLINQEKKCSNQIKAKCKRVKDVRASTDPGESLRLKAWWWAHIDAHRSSYIFNLLAPNQTNERRHVHAFKYVLNLSFRTHIPTACNKRVSSNTPTHIYITKASISPSRAQTYAADYSHIFTHSLTHSLYMFSIYIISALHFTASGVFCQRTTRKQMFPAFLSQFSAANGSQ